MDDISNLITIIIGGLAGGLIACFVNIYNSKSQAKKELKSLIIAFGEELVLAFERCVLYSQQKEENKVSFSGLFSFTDASTLSRLAAIMDDPEIIQAIVSLKSTYYQIGRHVEDASRFMGQAAKVLTDEPKRYELGVSAIQARNTALAFFDYEREKNGTNLIVERLKKLIPGKVADTLEVRFLDAKRKFEQIGEQPGGQSAGSSVAPPTTP